MGIAAQCLKIGISQPAAHLHPATAIDSDVEGTGVRKITLTQRANGVVVNDVVASLQCVTANRGW